MTGFGALRSRYYKGSQQFFFGDLFAFFAFEKSEIRTIEMWRNVEEIIVHFDVIAKRHETKIAWEFQLGKKSNDFFFCCEGFEKAEKLRNVPHE